MNTAPQIDPKTRAAPEVAQQRASFKVFSARGKRTERNG